MPADARLAHEARVVGLRQVTTPSLEAVERRRWQLWTVAFVVMAALFYRMLRTHHSAGASAAGLGVLAASDVLFAHSRLAVPEVLQLCCLVGSAWLHIASVRRIRAAFAAGVVFALAILAKLSALYLAPMPLGGSPESDVRKRFFEKHATGKWQMADPDGPHSWTPRELVPRGFGVSATV